MHRLTFGLFICFLVLYLKYARYYPCLHPNPATPTPSKRSSPLFRSAITFAARRALCMHLPQASAGRRSTCTSARAEGGIYISKRDRRARGAPYGSHTRSSQNWPQDYCGASYLQLKPVPQHITLRGAVPVSVWDQHQHSHSPGPRATLEPTGSCSRPKHHMHHSCLPSPTPSPTTQPKLPPRPVASATLWTSARQGGKRGVPLVNKLKGHWFP